MLASLEASAYRIHQLHRENATRVAAFVAGLDGDALQLRFDRFMTPASVAAHYAGIDWDRAVLLACDCGPDIRGVAEIYLYPASPAAIEAEIALVVAQGWRGRGIGRSLAERGLQAAARRGARRTTMPLSAGDHARARIARRLGFTIDADRAVLAHPCRSSGS